MAHDFGITHIDSGETAYFFGYAHGILYRVFDAQNHNNIISGDGAVEVVNYEYAKKGLIEALNSYEIIYYPDPHRADDLREFLELMDTHDKSSYYELYFG